MNHLESPQLGGKKIKSSLKEKLRNSPRLHASPILSTPQKTSEKSTTIITACEDEPTVEDSDNWSTFVQHKKLKLDEKISSELNNSVNNDYDNNSVSLLGDGKNHCEQSDEKDKLLQEVKMLKIGLLRREETLRKLQMVKTYRSKNDLTKLSNLIDKWRTAAQESLRDLHDKIPEGGSNLGKLIDTLQMDKKLIKYDSDNDDFI